MEGDLEKEVVNGQINNETGLTLASTETQCTVTNGSNDIQPTATNCTQQVISNTLLVDTNSTQTNGMNFTQLPSSNSAQTSSENEKGRYKVYGSRWFMLFIVCVLNLSNAMVGYYLVFLLYPS